MFEVRATDLAGRIGWLRTKSGVLETPALLPVVHPYRQTLPTVSIRKIGFEAVMTNAYIAMKNSYGGIRKNGIHRAIDFDGIVMTDSGGYQVLEYGDIEVSVESMAHFQEDIGSDIAVVLDKPTGFNASRRYAEKTVNLTLKAAEKTLAIRSRKDILWTGPIQGGSHLDIVETSAEKISGMNFDLYALGSPTEVMQAYDFRLLAAMILATKKKIPLGKPLHLFGAGHPLTIPLAIGLGCDLFDSASYMLYAREDRYLTDSGTISLKDISYLSCLCPVCTSNSLKDLLQQEKYERSLNIAAHNLHILLKAVKESKEAIREGRLWEHLGIKARGHPKLWEAFQALNEYIEFLEDGVPLFRSKAIFFMSPPDYSRPEVARHRDRLFNDVEFKKPNLLIMAESEVRPFYRSPQYSAIRKALGEKLRDIQVCFWANPFGIVPVEISDIYPLSQYVCASKPETSSQSVQVIISDLKKLIYRSKFLKIVIVVDEPYYEIISSEIGGSNVIIITDFNKDLMKKSKEIANLFA